MQANALQVGCWEHDPVRVPRVLANELRTRTPSRASISISASVLNGSIRPEANRSPEAPLHGEFRHFVQHFNFSEENLNPTVLKVYCFYVGKPSLKRHDPS